MYKHWLNATSLRNNYHAMFDQYGVDVVLAGHVHNYQRIFPIKYDPGSPDSPTRTSTVSRDYCDPVGQIYAIVGTGGVGLFGLADKPSFVKYQQDDRFGALDLSVENNGYTLAGRYYTNDGVKRDTFKITKTGTAQYNFGPSLSLWVKLPLDSFRDDASVGVSGGRCDAKNSQDNGNTDLGKLMVKERDLIVNTSHKQGPLRCREP